MDRQYRRAARTGAVLVAIGWFITSTSAQEASIVRPSLGPPRSFQPGDVPTVRPSASDNVSSSAPAANPSPHEPCRSAWIANPPVVPMPRPGNFGIFPSGPGYYSLKDCFEGNCLENAPKFPYGTGSVIPFSFFNADFRYLDDPKNTQHDVFDALHRIHLTDNWLFSTGGELRWRTMNEVNSRLSGADNNYDLFRARAYTDLWYRDAFRVYAEYLYADSFYQNLKPLAIDVNRSDLLNAFIDLKVAEWDNHNAYLRVGRQEMLLGSQRLVSPLDWANTRRTFDGASLFRQGEKCDFNFFWVSPVVVAANQFDSHDNNRNFAGSSFTYRPEKGQFLDLYYLFLDDASKTAQTVGKQPAVVKGPFNVHTIGARTAGDKNHFLWDIEGMAQFGEVRDKSIAAGAFTTGLGYNFADLPWNPTVWAYYDFASGDNSPNLGDYNTFNQLFPFGHYYFGALDLVGRQNIRDLNAHLYLYPTKWMTLNFQYHHFELDSAKDFLYSAGGVPLRRDPTGKAGGVVGNEFDVFVNFHLTAHSDLLVGYAHLQAGDFLRNTAATPSAARSPELFYVQYAFRW